MALALAAGAWAQDIPWKTDPPAVTPTAAPAEPAVTATAARRGNADGRPGGNSYRRPCGHADRGA